MMGPARNWSDARAKVDAEARCRSCGSPHNLEAAHITARKHDRPKPGTKTRWVNPDSVIVLCAFCHQAQHAGRLDISGLLNVDEAVQALRDYDGSVERLRRHLIGSDRYRNER